MTHATQRVRTKHGLAVVVSLFILRVIRAGGKTLDSELGVIMKQNDDLPDSCV